MAEKNKYTVIKRVAIFGALLLCELIIICFSAYVRYGNANTEQTVGNVIIDNELTSDDIIEITINPSDVELIAKTVYGEARGCSTVEQSAVIWCILNRVDAGYGSIEHVITKPYQFIGYKESNPVKGEFVELAIDVLIRWQAEKQCIGEVGRTLPDNYLWFHGDGERNYFRDKYNGNYNTWDWNCINPYP